MESESSIFEYIYRDAGNFKTVGWIRLEGVDESAEVTIRRCLEWGDQFVAEQVGIPSLCGEHWEAVEDGPSDLDHAFHEFVSLRPFGKGDASVKIWGSLDSVIARMRAAAGKWDVRLSPNSDL